LRQHNAVRCGFLEPHIEQDPVDEQQVLAQLDKVLNAEREVKRTQIALMVRIKNKLKPEQQARLRQLRSKPGGE
jgi:Spy/CpxP family protein refolding chaperone